jgi:tRNA nucleotidyltransferase/poly(A) polymerase
MAPQQSLIALLGRPPVGDLLALLNADGAETRIVGGAVRNALLGRPISDVDLATTLRPEAVMERAASARIKVVPTGLTHGTVTIIAKGAPFEVTTLRRDVETDGRHAVVAFSDSFEEDALRRDFTINQLSLSQDGAVHDYAGGLADIAARKVRFIGAPESRIAEDYLRILRFFRFHAEYAEGPLDGAGLGACVALQDGLGRLSAERVRMETLKLLAAQGVADVMPVFVASGFWARIAGEKALAEVEAFAAAVQAFPEADALRRLAALAVRGAGDAEALGARLRLSNAEARRLRSAAAALAALQSGEINETSVRLVFVRHGKPAAVDALAALALSLGAARVGELAGMEAPALPFDGAAVLALGIAPGPRVGKILDLALSIWADHGFPEDAAARAECLGEAARRI